MKASRLIGFVLLLFCVAEVQAQSDEVLQRMFEWPRQVLQQPWAADEDSLHGDTVRSNVYLKYHFNVPRRNFTMLTIPNLFHIAHGEQREFLGEMYSTVVATKRRDVSSLCHVHVSTIRHRRNTLANVRDYVSVRPYESTLVGDHLLSPFRPSNRQFYRYRVEMVDSATATVTITPRLFNTQLVSGTATIDPTTGRMLCASLEGEYDMIRFKLDLTMGPDGRASLRVQRCDLDATVRFIGNKLTAQFTCISDLPTTLPPTLVNVDSIELMRQLRPVPLSPTDLHAIAYLDSLNALHAGEQPDTLVVDTLPRRSEWLKHTGDAVWDAIQDNMLSTLHANFGNAERHRFSVGPIFNPLYFDYSKSRGLIYRTKMDFYLRMGHNSRLQWELRGGYAFKDHLIYFDTPMTWYFNERRNGYLQVAVANGNRISTSDVLEQVKQMHRGDTIDFDRMNLSYFKDLSFRTTLNYGFSSRLSGQLGFVFHRRSAVSKYDFNLVGKPNVYHTFAPMLELTWTPLGRRGPVLTADYEQGLRRVFGGDIGYSRCEFDGQWIVPLHCTRTLSLRAGVGFYLSKSGQRYFLDYAYFRRNNLPGGWNDDWSGEFELLRSEWYNASDYYVRFNGTYESPLLLFCRMPWIGALMERERIYFSALAVRNYFPFVEFGYGFTNRLCSVATFFAFSPHGYEGFGFKFGFELFSDW